MKKVFGVLAIATALVACNSGSENKEGADTTAKAADTAMAPVAPVTADTAMKAADTTTMKAADTTAKTTTTTTEKKEEVKH